MRLVPYGLVRFWHKLAEVLSATKAFYAFELAVEIAALRCAVPSIAPKGHRLSSLPSGRASARFSVGAAFRGWDSI
jgi:hypothetical protein